MDKEMKMNCPSVQAPRATDRQTTEKPPSLLELARRKLTKRRAITPIKLKAPSVQFSDLVWEWFQIALDESHIEPSQRCVGRITGWPQRSFTV